ncbi:MAG: hypothetical protein GY714_05425 [Desulfobacterales bacterium]|nr:hypothetical protein [Desulfobacterales bacterium]
MEDIGNTIIGSDSKRYKNFVKVRPVFKAKAYYAMISKQFVHKDHALAELIWDVIGETKKSERYKEIRRKYFLNKESK